MIELPDWMLIIEPCYFDFTAFMFKKIILRRLNCIPLVTHLVIELFVIVYHFTRPR